MSQNDRVTVSNPFLKGSVFLGKTGTVVKVLSGGWLDVRVDDVDGLIPFRPEELSLVDGVNGA